MKIPFKVSARTARLIGRENIATSKGAIIELVKNCYDADSPWVYIYIDNFFSSFQFELTIEQHSYLLNNGIEESLLSRLYSFDREYNKYVARAIIDDDDRSTFVEQAKRLSEIYIIDSGEGMTFNVISKNWMTIGTDNKAYSFLTHDKRIKAGAKGIGRFALDKLGAQCEMVSFFNPKYHEHDMSIREREGSIRGYLWKVNWEDFDVNARTIDSVDADLTEIDNASILDFLPRFNIPERMRSVFEDCVYEYGTILKIIGLRDDWNKELVKQVYSDLDVLVPPREVLAGFSLYLYSSLQPEEYGEIIGSVCDDYDYKLVAKADDKQNVDIHIYRKEYELDTIPPEFFRRPNMMNTPYSYEDFKIGGWHCNYTFSQLIPGFKDIDDNRILEQIGSFDFTFYYLKKAYTSDDERRFFYRQFSPSIRKSWLEAFGGIKIYRDNFRVRPYGEKNDAAYDWLGLGRRKAQSPAGVAKSGGGYRVEPDNVAGHIRISRLTNINFEDKSSREGLQENPVFDVFKALICSIIHIFEKDRSYIAHEMKDFDDEKHGDKREEERIEAYIKKKYAENEKRIKEGPNIEINEDEHALFVMAKANSQKDEEIAKLREEQILLRAMASSGIMLSAFSHDLSRLNLTSGSRYDRVIRLLSDIASREEYAEVEDRKNPFVQIDKMKKDNLRMQNWLKFSIGVARKDKRKRKSISLSNYLEQLKNDWEIIFDERNINLIHHVNESIRLKCFEIDLDSVFNNLITNSIQAFDDSKDDRPRTIQISIKQENDSLLIDYYDNGPGLSKDIVDPSEIFNALFTTRRNQLTGEEEGTGLGMWILQTIVNENKGKCSLLFPEIGFGLRIVLPYNE